ncbi:MAG: hypothetical protein AB2L24_26785 [Mangrovibacterium sp.]
MSKKIIAFLLLILPSFLAGQVVHDQGFPWLRNFSPAEYKGHTQNFAVVSDHHGLTYFGNFAGVLQFDGQGWRLIPTEKTTRVSALAVDSTGTVYVGALGEIGFLAPDQQGKLHFSSLLKDQSNAYPAFGEVGNIFITGDGLNFISRDHILKVKGGNAFCLERSCRNYRFLVSERNNLSSDERAWFSLLCEGSGKSCRN